MTKEEVLSIINNYISLDKKIIQVSKEVFKFHYPDVPIKKIKLNWYFEECIHTDVYYNSCGCSECEADFLTTLVIPLAYLSDPNFLEKEKNNRC